MQMFRLVGESNMDEKTSNDILKALLLILSKVNNMNNLLGELVVNLKESANPKQEESN